MRVGLFPTKLQYSSSWLPTQLGDITPHFPWLPPPLLVRRYDVVFSELEGGEVTFRKNTDRKKIGMSFESFHWPYFTHDTSLVAVLSDLTGPMWF